MLHKPIFKVEKYGIPFYLRMLTTFMVGYNDHTQKVVWQAKHNRTTSNHHAKLSLKSSEQDLAKQYNF